MLRKVSLMFGLMICYCCFDILDNFEQGAPHFHFGSHELIVKLTLHG